MPRAETNFEKHREGFEELNALWERLDTLERALKQFSETALTFVEEPIERVIEKIYAFEPSVSIIGQVKSGKSTLLNALVGQTEMLPSDVNPWTSVITALHLNSRHRPLNTRALFRFFDAHEWDRLVATGGRLGEMAERAGFATEAAEVRLQVSEMRQTTEARLGDEFERLLGKSHVFPDLKKDTINRYICYGDPDDPADGTLEGVFADITKSADLYLDLPYLLKGLCLRDTPGVNDTFMMREQITLNAISDSRVCVVVLSAHQALSTMDVALLRIICSVEAREVLIFVNRIDELEDPEGEKEKIRASIEKTLKRLGLGEEVQILFGSGYWANCAIDPTAVMAPASRAALAHLYGDDTSDPELLRTRAMEASGVYELLRAIARRVIEGPGSAILNDVQNEIKMIIEMSETVENLADQKNVKLASPGNLSAAELNAQLSDLRDKALHSLDTNADELRNMLRGRLERAQTTFLASALEALQAHIEAFGEIGSWNHDPTVLRMMMKTAFTSCCAKLRREGEIAFDILLDGVQEILENDLGVFRDGGTVDFPEQPAEKPPTILARTLSLDLQGPWWRKYWRFGAVSKARKRYEAVILAETSPLIDDLINDVFDPAVERTRAIVDAFAMDQARFCKAVFERSKGDGGVLDPEHKKLSA